MIFFSICLGFRRHIFDLKVIVNMETPLWLLCLLFTAYSSAHPYSTPLPPRITTYTRIRSSLSVPPYPPRQLYASTPLQLITPHYQVLQSRITHTLRPNEIENTSDGSERSAIPIGVVSILIAFGSFLVGVVSLFLYREVQKSRDSQGIFILC